METVRYKGEVSMGIEQKTKYEELELDVVVFEGTDVVCASPNSETPREDA